MIFEMLSEVGIHGSQGEVDRLGILERRRHQQSGSMSRSNVCNIACKGRYSETRDTISQNDHRMGTTDSHRREKRFAQSPCSYTGSRASHVFRVCYRTRSACILRGTQDAGGGGTRTPTGNATVRRDVLCLVLFLYGTRRTTRECVACSNSTRICP